MCAQRIENDAKRESFSLRIILHLERVSGSQWIWLLTKTKKCLHLLVFHNKSSGVVKWWLISLRLQLILIKLTWRRLFCNKKDVCLCVFSMEGDWDWLSAKHDGNSPSNDAKQNDSVPSTHRLTNFCFYFCSLLNANELKSQKKRVLFQTGHRYWTI